MSKLGVPPRLLLAGIALVGLVVGFVLLKSPGPEAGIATRLAAPSSEDDGSDEPLVAGGSRLVPAPGFGRELGIAASNFLPTREDAPEPEEPDLTDLSRDERRLAEKFATGNLQRLAGNMVVTAPAGSGIPEPTPTGDPALEPPKGGGR